jgi:hypothetical protein
MVKNLSKRLDLAPQLRIAQPAPLLLDRQLFERLVARAHRERVQRSADPHHHADRPSRDLRGERQPLSARVVHRRHQAAPALRVLVAVGQQEPDRPAGFLGELAHPAQLVLLVIEIAVHAECAGAGDAERRADPQKLQIVGIARRHEVAIRRLVRVGARGGEAEGADVERLDGEPPHFGDVVRGRRLAADGAVTHHIDPHRQMRGLRRDVDRALAPLQRIHEFREAFPFPGQAGGEYRVGDFLDAFHQVHQRAAMMLLHRREADTAIAEHHRGDAVPARGRQQRVPHRLPVIMGVHVDPAGRDQEPVGVDLAPRRTLLAADRRDAAARDRNVAGEGRRAAPVDDPAASNDDVVHGRPSTDDGQQIMRPSRGPDNGRSDAVQDGLIGT